MLLSLPMLLMLLLLLAFMLIDGVGLERKDILFDSGNLGLGSIMEQVRR